MLKSDYRTYRDLGAGRWRAMRLACAIGLYRFWNRFFDWLEKPHVTKDGKRLYTTASGDGNDPTAKP